MKKYKWNKEKFIHNMIDLLLGIIAIGIFVVASSTINI